MKYFCCVESLYSLAPASGDQWDIISLLMQALLPQSNACHGRIFLNLNFLTNLLSIILKIREYCIVNPKIVNK